MWYDPITERWYKMPTQKEPIEVIEVKEDDYVRAARLVRQNNIWDALKDVCSAQ